MRKRRVLFFLMAAIVGILAGIGYGWWLRPMFYTQASLSNLRVDYRTDYVLMTAEIFHQENNLEEATQRLQSLGTNPSDRYAREALLSAGQLGYGQQDLQLLANLVQALSPSVEGTATPGTVQP